jgi:hypothetical protein
MTLHVCIPPFTVCAASQQKATAADVFFYHDGIIRVANSPKNGGTVQNSTPERHMQLLAEVTADGRPASGGRDT